MIGAKNKMPERYDNLFLSDTVSRINYINPQQNGPRFRLPDRDARQHGANIRRQLDVAWQRYQEELTSRQAVAVPTREGMYLEFESAPGFDLKIKSLEDLRAGVRLLNVRTVTVGEHTVQRATIFVPHDKRAHFLNKTVAYMENGKNKPLLASIEGVRQAVLESFWQGDAAWMPATDVPVWCEIWLSSDKPEVLAAFKGVAAALGIQLKEESIYFPERTVILALVHRNHLLELVQSSPYIAEFRRAPETARFFVEQSNRGQREWVDDLLARLQVLPDGQVSVCVLDTGVNNGHALLQPLMEDDDRHAYNSSWGTYDDAGHGTEMAGIAAYGDLQEAATATAPVQVAHKLESVKILPPVGANNPELYGAITSQGISRVEIQHPEYQRILCMAVTTDAYSVNDGRPDSWSGAIDEIASGYLDDKKRLFFVSAGNVRNREDYLNYPASNISCRVESPGQAWNAVTVGAYTVKDTLTDPNLQNAQRVAPREGLSPFSTTSCLWEQNKWPVKPEILLEGGNLIRDDLGCFTCDDLSVLTTYYKPAERLFTCFGQTSAATAQAAWMAAQLQAAYPDAWPETIRGLMIHSADWTFQMRQQFLPENPSKGDYHHLLRTCGYGVPDLARARWCAQNSVNLIVQGSLQPYDHNGGRYTTKDMHIHQLPWPREVLLALGAQTVRMRVTLSYFIEPSPGEIGWKDRYRYASCALRFDVNNVNEDLDNFNRRLNAAARDESEFDNDSGSDRWLIGKNTRHRGSVHSDIWEGTAAELATSNLIGIYPAIGWWRERHGLGRWDKEIRYSLIVSLSTEAETVDLYTPVVNMIRIRVPIEITR